MDNETNNLSFDQLPKAVGELLTKVDYVISRLDLRRLRTSSPARLRAVRGMVVVCGVISRGLRSPRRCLHSRRGRWCRGNVLRCRRAGDADVAAR